MDRVLLRWFQTNQLHTARLYNVQYSSSWVVYDLKKDTAGRNGESRDGNPSRAQGRSTGRESQSEGLRTPKPKYFLFKYNHFWHLIQSYYKISCVKGAYGSTVLQSVGKKEGRLGPLSLCSHYFLHLSVCLSVCLWINNLINISILCTGTRVIAKWPE